MTKSGRTKNISFIVVIIFHNHRSLNMVKRSFQSCVYECTIYIYVIKIFIFITHTMKSIVYIHRDVLKKCEKF